MCRMKRKKDGLAYYHIIVRGSSEITLFRSKEDKAQFLKYLKKYKELFDVYILSFCIMDTHAHLLIYSNGADISKVMHGINLSYAMYYNRTYNRHGHVFSDRFKSKIIYGQGAIKRVSAYIHNNPKDIKGFRDHVESYEYSSMKEYCGGNSKIENSFINIYIILNYFGKDPIKSRIEHLAYVKARLGLKIDDIDINDINDIKNINEDKSHGENLQWEKDVWEYISGTKIIKRVVHPDKIIEFLCEKFHIFKDDFLIKYSRKVSEYRAIAVFLMRRYCDMNFKDISYVIGNLTLASLSSLCSKGQIIISKNEEYKDVIKEFLNSNIAAEIS
ncbi:transposase [Clostridium grantii]|uniref:DnaA protein helix-turn-helix n=1 Tax=Clostridium grantii DSM 8605 TaxID=1121316 RepID=A0A1M5RGM8_9CLOT|nr:transposase [Clostridium grantii]SHH24923.1 dnaA protein helix-turn-helix [Clostridium grantii DSM 8605]